MTPQCTLKLSLSRCCGFIIVLLALLSTMQKAGAVSGLGVSGSFGSHHFIMIPGETMAASGVEVIFFNNTASDMDLALEGRGPSGIRFFFEAQEVRVKAKSSLRVPVSFKLSDVQGLGDSEISVVAHIVSQPGSGISWNGFAQLRARLTVLAQAGEVSIRVQNVRQTPISADLVLVRLNEDKTQTPIRDGYTEGFTERLVPGTYQITALKQGVIIAQNRFELKDKEVLQLTLTARFVSIPVFLAGPQNEPSGQIRNVSVAYTLLNLDQPEKNVRMVLRFEKDGQLLEVLDLMSLPELYVGESSGRLSISPMAGFTNAKYTLTLSLYSEEGLLLAESAPQRFEVKVKSTVFVLKDLSTWMAMAVVTTLSAVLFRKKTAVKS